MSLIDLHKLGLPSGPNFIGSGMGDLAGILGGSVGALVDPPASPAGGAPFSTIYAFGDSLSDAGNVYAMTLHLLPAAPYTDGHFSNGPVWVQDLAAQLGLPAPQPSMLGGNDFAYAGAETGSDALHTQNPTDLPSQLVQFAVAHPVPQPDALYTVTAGANDVLGAISAFAGDPGVAATDIAQAVGNETRFISALAADGARDLLVLNVPDLGRTPSETARGPQVAQAASSLSASYDAQLAASLSTSTCMCWTRMRCWTRAWPIPRPSVSPT
jgi:phospholipase/lecithinase/hemolysin